MCLFLISQSYSFPLYLKYLFSSLCYACILFSSTFFIFKSEFLMLVSSEPKLIPMLLKLQWIYSLGVQMSNPYVHLQLYLVQIFVLLF